MKKILFSAWMVALVALAGCQQNDELTGVDKKVSLTANIKANAQSRVAMEYVTGADGGSTIKVDWKGSGESFQMYDATDDTKVSTFTQTSGNQFEGTLPSVSGSYYAVYGDDANLVNQDGTLKEDYVWMMDNDVTDLTQPIEFIHQTTVLKPDFIVDGDIINESITKIVMDGISLPGDAEAITITPSEEEDIFIFLPAFNIIEVGTTFNFTVTTADNKEYVAALTISADMEQGYFYTANIHLEEVIPFITFTSNKAIGEEITITVKFASEVDPMVDTFIGLTDIEIVKTYAEENAYDIKGKLTSNRVGILKNVLNLNVNDLGITSIDVRNAVNLEVLQCTDNQIKSLNVSNNTKLILLNCKNNLIEKLDLSNNTKLNTIKVEQNKLTSLVVGCSILTISMELNELNKTAMDALISSMEYNSSGFTAQICVKRSDSSEKNEITATQIADIQALNYEVYLHNGSKWEKQ